MGTSRMGQGSPSVGCRATLRRMNNPALHDLRDRIDEMAAIVRAAEPDETHLVLSAAASRPATERAAEAFMVAGCDRAIVTKLDEAVVFGPIPSTLMTLDLPLSWFTNGQEVPANISPARPRQLAESLQPQQTVV